MKEENGKFMESFEKSPIGILFFDKEGNLTDANKSALEIGAIPSLDDVIGYNIFNNVDVASIKDELLEKGSINIQAPVDFNFIRKLDVYNPTKSGIVWIDLILSVIDSGFLAQIRDITEQKKAEKALKNSEKRYKQLFNSMTETFQVFELIYNYEGKPIDYRYLDANPAIERVVGKSREEVIGKSVKELFGIVEDYWLEILDKVVKSGEATHYIDYGQALNKYFDIYAWKIGENKVGVIASDITEQEKAEEKTKKILENIAEAYMELDNEWRFIDVNSKTEEIYGFKKDELIGRIIWEVIPRAVGSKQHKEFHRAKKENIPVRFEAKSVMGDWFEVNAHPHPEGLTIYAHNIMQRKKAEEELKKSEEEYRYIVEFAPTGIYEIDYRGPSFKSVNDAMCHILGYSREELMAMNPFDILSDESKIKFQERIRKMLNGEKIDENVDFQVITRDGHEIWANLNVKSIYREGKPEGALVVAHDITERKKLEGRLKEAHDTLELKVKERTEELENAFAEISDLYNNAPCGYHSLNKDAYFVRINDTELMWLGYSREEIIGEKKFSDLITEESKKTFYENYTGFMKRGYVNDLEFDMIRKDGTILPVLVNATAIKDSNGNFVMSRSTLFDITERKKSEEELQKSRESFRTLAENSPDNIIRLDKNLRYVYVNPAAAKITGKSPEDFLDKTYEEVGIPEEYATLWRENNLKAIETGEIQYYEFEFQAIDGLKYIESMAIPEFNMNGEIESALVLDRDITERKNTEEELRRSKTSFKTLAENSPDIINRIDKEFKTVYINPAIIEISGKPPEHFIGKNIGNLGIPEEFTVPLKEKSIKAFKTGEIQEFETEMPTVKGLKIFYTYLAPEFDEKGEVNTVFTVSHDITELKQAEKQLKETILELKRSNKELEQFAYISSHDLQEPLRTIASFTQLLERRYKGKFDSDADEFMDFIVDAAVRMKEQIEGLLEYSRVETKGGEFKPLDTNEILRQTINRLNTFIKESNAEIIYDELPVVVGDAEQLQRVFQNLISNAIRFRKCEERLKIHISAVEDKENNEYVFSVQDNGIGIEEQYMERIFTIFQRLHTRNEYKGTGIGLSIVKRVIERHGGRIWAESEFGKGSVFYFTIPL